MKSVSHIGSLCGCFLALISFWGTSAQRQIRQKKIKQNQLLMQAIEKNDFDGVKKAVEAGAKPGFYNKKKRESPLLRAAKENRPEIADYLLYTLYTVDSSALQKQFAARDAAGKTVLDYAIDHVKKKQDNVQLLYELLFWGVPLDGKNKKKNTAYEQARADKQTALANMLGYVQELRQAFAQFTGDFLWRDGSLNVFEADRFLMAHTDYIKKWGLGFAALFVAQNRQPYASSYIQFLSDEGVTYSTPVFGRYLLSRVVEYSRWDKKFNAKILPIVQDGTNLNLVRQIYVD